MKKIIIICILVLICILTLTVGFAKFVKKLVENNDTSPYPQDWRDTVVSFGNRRIAILRGYNHELGRDDWTLYDRDIGCIDDDVYGYKEISPYVYTYGSNGYIKMNYENGEYDIFKTLNEITENDKAIFERLENKVDGKYPPKRHYNW